ncbi:MAG: hypothetical protein ABGZ53_28375, partial [Fuerstiella sp.]
QNDDYFSEDSFLELSLAPGDYYIGVSSTGNDDYDPSIAGTGIGGTSQGAYDLRVNFRPDVLSPTNALIDLDNGNEDSQPSTGGNNTVFDGDGDGEAGGVYNFWFRAVGVNDTLFVDKATVSHLSGPITAGTLVIPIAQTSTIIHGDVIVIGNEKLLVDSVERAAGTLTVLSRGHMATTPIGHAAGDLIARDGATGAADNPFGTIGDALAAAVPGQIVRIVGNDLDANGHLLDGAGGLAEDDLDSNDLAYLLGKDTSNNILEDGSELLVPKGVTVMVDNGAIFKLRESAIGVGTTSSLVDRSGSALQILGVPDNQVIFTSLLDETIGNDTTSTPTEARSGNWGGIFFRNDLDQSQGRFIYEDEAIFLNHVGQADIRFGGGNVTVDSTLQPVAPINLTDAQPTIVYNNITGAAASAMSANPDSFEELTFHSARFQDGATPFTSDYGRIGPDFGWNILTENSTNGLFIRITTTSADPIEKLTVPARFDDADIVHVIAQNLEIQGTPGGAIRDTTTPDVALVTVVTEANAATDSVWADAGTYDYIVVFVDSNGFESPASVRTATATIDADGDTSDQSIRLARLPIAPADYVGRRLYRSPAGGGVTSTYTLAAELDRSTTVHVDNGEDLQRSLNATPPTGRDRARIDARLSVDPGVVVKLESARIESEMGAQFIAEGVANREIIFTSRLDDRYGAGGTFDTNGDGDLVAPLQTLFSDDFTASVLDPAKWAFSFEATPDDTAINEPTAPLSAHLPGSALGTQLVSTVVDLSAEDQVELEYSYQRTGAGESPDANDDLLLEFRDASGAWIEISRQLGSGPDMIVFETVIEPLPLGANHDNFAFRFSNLSGAATLAEDDWYVDDVRIRQARLSVSPEPGNWGGIYIGHLGSGSIDHSLITFGGGEVAVESDFAAFNALEIHQSEVRVRNSVFEENAAGRGGTLSTGGSAPENRFGLYLNQPGAIFVRAAQPVILDNEFRNNAGPAININVNALNSELLTDPGRSTGVIDRQAAYPDNQGPLVRDNRLGGLPTSGSNTRLGMLVRGETLTTESVWDDTDITHVVENLIYVPDLHTSGGLRLESSPNESLVIKLKGPSAGFTADGYPLDIVDRIGGMLHVVGQPGFPVVMTSIADDSVGAGLGLDGLPLLDTNNDGNSSDPTAAANRWAGVSIEEYAHDRNVSIYLERELADATLPEVNASISSAETIGSLASDEYSGDENERLGFQIHGTIDSLDDQDIYSFSAVAGTQVWLDIDRTSVGLDTVIDLVNANGDLLAQSDNSPESGFPDIYIPLASTTQAFTLDYSQYNSDDLYTLNALDAGMRVVLPGDVGQRQSYFVRVRSSQIDSSVGGARTAVEDNIGAGLTTGVYQLQVRLQELDEFAGTAVNHADIRYATTGIHVSGHPKHSPLLGEIAEYTTADTTPLPALLNSDRGAISVAGDISPAEDDVDFYSFTLEYDPTTIPAHTTAHVPVTFDLDFADGFTRANTTIAIFDSQSRLILIGRDSNIADDQTGIDNGSAASDLTRGSNGTLDPFIGPVELLTGTSYTMAVFSNAQVPQALDQFFVSNPTLNNGELLRIEPINSVTRVTEERFGLTDTFTTASAPTTDLFNVFEHPSPSIGATLNSSHVVPFNLGDVNLFISRSGSIDGTDNTSVYMVDPFTGQQETVLGDFGPSIADIAMRPDGELYAFSTGPQTGNRTAGNVGNYLQINTGTANLDSSTDDGLSTFVVTPGGPPNTATLNPNGYYLYQALAYSGTADSSLYAVGNRQDRTQPSGTTFTGAAFTTNVLFNFTAGTGAVDGDGPDRLLLSRATSGAGTSQQEVGQIDTTAGGANGGIVRSVVGSAFVGGNLWVITDLGDLFTVSTASAATTFRGRVSAYNSGTDTYDPIVGQTFTGLAPGPDSSEIGDYDDLLFAVSSSGRLFAFDTDLTLPIAASTAGQAQPIFSQGAVFVDVTTTGIITGLAFGTLERNLWHVTSNERTGAADDPGHGIDVAFDRSTINSRGGNSLYFGNDNSDDNGVTGRAAGNKNNWATGEVNDVNFPGGAHGTVISNPISLANYSEADKPALYFNYFLETEPDQNSNFADNPETLMRDSLRVFVAGDDGQWHLLVTNNSEASSIRHDEFDWGPTDTASDNLTDQPGRLLSPSSAVSQPFPDVVEAFDTANWRQAKVDLSNYAGQENLRLRFDFSTAGQMALGNIQTTGSELRAVPGNAIADEDIFTISRAAPAKTVTFEFNRG